MTIFCFCLVRSPDGSKQLQQSKSNDIDVEVKEEPMSGCSSQLPTDTVENATSDDSASGVNSGESRNEAQTRNQVLEALKSRIRELETETKAIGDEKFKCLICMVSIYFARFLFRYLFIYILIKC